MALKEINKKIGKNSKNSKCRDFRQNCPKCPDREMALKEINKKKIGTNSKKNSKYRDFRQNCPKCPDREMPLKEITKQSEKNQMY